MKKRLLSALLTVLMLCTLLPTAALALDSAAFENSSWFGQYFGGQYQRYFDFTINDCDANGKFHGTAKVTTVEGQGTNHHGLFEIEGNMDFGKNTFYINETKVLEDKDGNGSTWNKVHFSGDIVQDLTGEITLSGIMLDREDCPFNVSRTSAWARDEMTEANILGLIPETLKGADMSRRITRGEFAAVAVQLYETLSGNAAEVVETPFKDIAGNANAENIAKAYGLGLTVGVLDGEFAPDKQITREELATMLSRSVKKYAFPGWTIETDGSFPIDTSAVPRYADDADISDFAKPSVYYMTQLGTIKGVDDTHFAPKNTTTQQEAIGYATATREQALAISLRIYKLLDSWR